MEIGNAKKAAAGIPERDSSRWIAEELNMGQAASVSAFVSRVRNGEMNNEIKALSTRLAD
jgi:hypothetical protein